MKTRPMFDAYNSIEEVKAALNFDRFSVVDIGHTVNLPAINRFLSSYQLIWSERLYIEKQLGVYYLFYLRNREQALVHLKEYRELLKQFKHEHNESYAEVCNFIGHAETIDGSYQDLEEFFKALNIYDELNTGSVSETLGRAFALRYLGLILYRKGHSFLASDYLKQALALQQKCVNTHPNIHADIAESLHILGVIAVRQDQFQEGKRYFEQALEEWSEFQATLGYVHPISFISMQSLGSLYTRLNFKDVGKHLLEEALKSQVEYYGTIEHADVAKTLHFLGDTLKALNPAEALAKYLEAIKIKVQLYGEDSPIYKATKNAMLDVLPTVLREFPFDWNDYRTIAPSEKQLSTILASLKLFNEKLLKDNIPDLALFFYKLGEYYLHVTRDANSALDALYQARSLQGWLAHWVEVQQAFAYQQRMFECNKPGDIVALRINYNCALTHVNHIILYNNDPNDRDYASHIKILAYAYCVKALIIYERKDATSLEEAIATYKLALDLYDKYNLHDDQYARAKCRYAMMLGEHKNTLEAHKIFKELKTYWAANPDPANPYRGRFESCYKDFKKNLPEGYNPKVFKAAVPMEVVAPEPQHRKRLTASV